MAASGVTDLGEAAHRCENPAGEHPRRAEPQHIVAAVNSQRVRGLTESGKADRLVVEEDSMLTMARSVLFCSVLW